MVAKNVLAGYRQTTNACWFRWRFTQIASVRSSLQQLQHASDVGGNAARLKAKLGSGKTGT
jgi:hypothetical protein